jgi:hypothetical protein
MLRNVLVLTAALLAATACGPLSARPLVDLDVIDRDSGQQLPEYRHHGQHWIPGTPGHRYSVRLTNTSSERVLVILSVDGVNAVSGQTANPSQAGYVLAPWQSTEINGWRKSLDDVAQFVFTDLPDSYAARTGRPDNVGVIGIAVFRETRPIVYQPPVYDEPEPLARGDMRDNGMAAAKAAAPAAQASGRAAESAADSSYSGIVRQSIGTGHGEREWSPVSNTDFERASTRPSQIAQLRYDAPEALAALGILPQPRRYYGAGNAPTPFPAGFVADPPGW